MTTSDAGASPVDQPVVRPVPERASACGLTECRGKPECSHCAAMRRDGDPSEADAHAILALRRRGVRVVELNEHDAAILRNTRRRVNRARNFPENTCAASRHLHLMAEQLASGKPYAMLAEEPQHCAMTMLAVLESLWKARTELANLKRHNVRAKGLARQGQSRLSE